MKLKVLYLKYVHLDMNILTLKTKSLNSEILSNLVKRLFEAEICPADALDELVNVDPETELGKGLTKMMTYVSSLGLFDFYKGYVRSPDGNVIKSYFSNDAKPESMEKLIGKIETDIEGPVIDDPDAIAPIIKAKLIKSTTGLDFDWVVELRIFSQKANEKDIPVEIDMEGELDVSSSGGEAPVKEPEEM